MSVLNSVKKEIAKDWLDKCPDLLAYTQNKLYKIVGPFVLGIEIFSQPGGKEYRPYFVVYGLWVDNLKFSLKEAAIIQEMYTKKGFQFDIPYTKHELYFAEVIEAVREQVRVPFDGNISLDAFYRVVDDQFLDTLVKSSPAAQAELYTYKLFAALYVNDHAAIDKVFHEIDQASKNWLPQYFEWRYGKFETWYQNLHEVVNNRSSFLARIELNKSDEKLRKLNYSELVRC